MPTHASSSSAFSESLLNDLNTQQRAAVMSCEGPSLVVAGAGSGKTRVLTYKIAYLLSLGVKPYRILALTFTNKAAREMRSRVASLLGDKETMQLRMGTFHSVFSRILRNEAEKIGFTHDYTIYDTQDSRSLIKSIIKQMQLDEKIYKPSQVHSRISLAKNNLLSPLDYSRDKSITLTDNLDRMYQMPEIYSVYEQRLKESNAMDFDDLLFNTFRLLANNEEVKQKYQRLFEFILVDEFQDTNIVQYCIVKMLSGGKRNICVVGDDAQSIYSFRGANIGNILSFQSDYPDAKLFKLEQNYRSTQTIVNAANSLISKNKNRIPKEVYSENEVGTKLRYFLASDDRSEARHVVEEVVRCHRRLVEYDDMAILYRTNAQSRLIEDELRRNGVKYRIYGGVAFYQRKEIKDVLAYVRLAVNHRDNESLRRIINYPARGIGDTTLKKLSDAALAAQVSLLEVVADPQRYGVSVNNGMLHRLLAFHQLIMGLSEKSSQMSAQQFIRQVLDDSGILESARNDLSTEGQETLANIIEMVNSAAEFEQRRRLNEGDTSAEAELPSISEFLEEVALLTDQDENLTDTESRVTLMTIHAAKGLEYKVVFVAGLEEGLLPSSFVKTEDEVEEERRLFYVAVTRAKEQCFLSGAKGRFRNGEFQFSQESRFVKDIDRSYLSKEEASAASDARPTSHWGGWNMPSIPTAPTVSTAPTAQMHRVASTKSQPSAGRQQLSNPQFDKGTRVRHQKFGDGTVIDTYIENDNEKVEVKFDHSGVRVLMLRFAKLDRVEG